MGLGALVGKVTVDTLCPFQVKIVRGLVYVLKKLPIYASKEQEETSQVLTQVIRVVNNVDEANSEPRRQSFQGVVEFLASELFNPNSSNIVRKNVQSCLAILASRTGSEVSELLEPLYQPLLQPLIMRPLRSKTVDQQVFFFFLVLIIEVIYQNYLLNLLILLSGWNSYGFEFLFSLEASSSEVDSRIS